MDSVFTGPDCSLDVGEIVRRLPLLHAKTLCHHSGGGYQPPRYLTFSLSSELYSQKSPSAVRAYVMCSSM
jgi:hypothetical protein